MPPSPRLRAVASALTAAAIGLAGLVASASPAAAHATLIKVTPADGATLTAAPSEVRLDFDEAVSSRFASVVVTGPTGEDVTGGAATVNGRHVSAPVAGNLGSGEYRVAFRVVSDDGHPVTGQSRFTLHLAAEPASSAAPVPSPSGATPAPGAAPARLPGEETSWVSRNLPALAGALLLLVIGAGALLWDRRRG